MTEVNINTRPEGPPLEPSGSDRTSSAAINFLTVLLVVIAIIAILWFLFNGPFQAAINPPAPTNINVNPPTAPNVNVNPPTKP